jgi:hypothetical protein
VVTNKRDFDFEIAIYEPTPDGKYVQFACEVWRASMVHDRTARSLFTPGVPRRMNFDPSLLMSRIFQEGSRLIVLLEAIKTPAAQINYGTGKDVSDETITDARAPLAIHWLSDIFINIPTSRRLTPSPRRACAFRQLAPFLLTRSSRSGQVIFRPKIAVRDPNDRHVAARSGRECGCWRSTSPNDKPEVRFTPGLFVCGK